MTVRITWYKLVVLIYADDMSLQMTAVHYCYYALTVGTVNNVCIPLYVSVEKGQLDCIFKVTSLHSLINTDIYTLVIVTNIECVPPAHQER